MGGRVKLNRWIRVWFALDGIIALAPPLYLWVGRDMAPIAGLPATLVYFVVIDLLIAASLFVAYFTESREGLSS